MDPLEWQVSEKTADNISASMANTIGAAESVFRVAASGHDKKLLCKVGHVHFHLSLFFFHFSILGLKWFL